MAQLLGFLGYSQDGIEVEQDNQAAMIVSITGDSRSGRLKHILSKQLRVKEAIEDGLIVLKETRTDEIKADVLTKAITGAKFHKFVSNVLNL